MECRDDESDGYRERTFSDADILWRSVALYSSVLCAGIRHTGQANLYKFSERVSKWSTLKE